MNPIIFPYKIGSNSARYLAQVLGTVRVYSDRKYRPKENHLVINWGNSNCPSWLRIRNNQCTVRMLNSCQAVHDASNKLNSFQKFLYSGVSTPEWTTDYNLVINWFRDNPALIVYGRETLTGHSGQGIVLLTENNTQVTCPVYTKQVKCKKEFRVHIFNSQVIDITQKRRKAGTDVSVLIKNLSNGWVFTRQDMIVPECVVEEAQKAVKALGLDFGAVDVAWNEHQNKAFVFEVNTAPGLEGTTVIKYKEAIEHYASTM